jgi:rhodanese-related sulfurtransferase
MYLTSPLTSASLSAQFTLIDVREPGELREGIIPTATNVPLVRDVATLLKIFRCEYFPSLPSNG